MAHRLRPLAALLALLALALPLAAQTDEPATSPYKEAALSGAVPDDVFLQQATWINAVEGSAQGSGQGSASAAQAASSLNEIREIYPTVTRPSGVTPCTVYLLKGRVFKTSQVYQSKYVAPKKCGTSFRKVVLSIQGRSNGLQYSSALTIFLNKLQIVRTSTPIALYNNGIKWAIDFDLTKYSTVFAADRYLTATLPISNSGGVSGVYNITAILSIYPGTKSAQYPNTVLAVPSPSLVPQTFKLTRLKSSVNVPISGIPRNAYRVILEVSVHPSGQDSYPFFSIPRRYATAFPYVINNKTVFHEVRAAVDRFSVGSIWPKPTLSPNQVSLTFWSNTVGIGVMNIPSYFLDITPLVGTLVDGKTHLVSFSVSNISSNSVWQVSANLLIWVDSKLKQTSGKVVTMKVPVASPKVSATFPTTAFNIASGQVSISVATSTVLSGFVVTSFGNLSTSVTVAKSFTHVLKLRSSGSSLQSSQQTSATTKVITKDKKGKIWYSLSESNVYPFTISIEGLFPVFVAYSQAIQASKLLLYAPGQSLSVKLNNQQRGSGVYDDTGSLGNAYQRVAVSDGGCYTRTFDQGGYSTIFLDSTTNGAC